MLESLHIENVAVIERADVEFRGGLNILTGETGAGKSILIDAINAVLGERVRRDLVRAGCDEAQIFATFSGISDAVREKLTEAGYAPAEDTLLIQRTIRADGKSGCRIDGIQDLELVSLALHLDHGIDDLVSLPDGVLGCDGFLDQVSGLHDGVHDVQSLCHVGGDER